jgi:hypothetical protein
VGHGNGLELFGPGRLLTDAVQILERPQQDLAIQADRRGDRHFVDLVHRQDLESITLCEHERLAILASEVQLAIRQDRRGAKRRAAPFQLACPDRLAGLQVETRD